MPRNLANYSTNRATTPGDHESPTIEEGTKDDTIKVNTNNEKSTEANIQVTNSNVGEEGGSGTIIAVVIVLIVV